MVMSIARGIGFFLTFASLILVIYQGGKQLASGDWKSLLWGGFIAFAVYVISFCMRSLSWCLLIGGLSQIRTGWRDLEIYGSSSLMRRTPGMVWYFLELTERYRSEGIGGRLALVTSGAEWILLTISALLVYMLTFFDLSRISYEILTIASVPPFLGLSVFAIQRRSEYRLKVTENWGAINLWRRLLRAWPEIAMTVLLYGICYLLGGLMINELGKIFDPTSNLFLRDSVRLWALSMTVVTLGSVVIPVNLGLRDLTVGVLLASFVSVYAAIAIAALLRVVFAIADVSCSLGLWETAKRMRPRTTTLDD